MQAIKVKIQGRTIPEAINDLVWQLAKKKRVRPSHIALAYIPTGYALFDVKMMNRPVGTISKVFDTVMFVPQLTSLS